MSTPRPSFLFFHAHPDDEAIFTGGTIAKLADAGAGVTVVLATDDESGPERRLEAEAAAAVLKVDRLDFLGYPDSGLGPNPSAGSFAATPTADAAGRLATIATEVGADALIVYDESGIYGHPDHLAVHRVGKEAARRAGVGTVYESTVDREHLHFVATHLVGHAVEALMGASNASTGAIASTGATGVLGTNTTRSGDGKLAGGTPTVLIDLAIDVGTVLDRKRAAMVAHTSQIPPDSEAMQLDATTFAAVYGQEWYLRSGPPTLLDTLGA